MGLPIPERKIKPRFQITLEDMAVPDSLSSINRLRMILKMVLRKHAFQCLDIREIPAPPVGDKYDRHGSD